MRPRRHVIITGTGRAGTTALVQILTLLGLPTGYTAATCRRVDPRSRAGLEWPLTHPAAPYIVKSPFLCDTLGPTLAARPDITVECALVPIRDLGDAAASRVHNAQAVPHSEPDRVMGGLFGTKRFDEQEGVLAEKLYRLMLTLAEHQIPVVLMQHPRFLEDGSYLYTRLRLAFPELRESDVHAARAAVYDPTAGFRKFSSQCQMPGSS